MIDLPENLVIASSIAEKYSPQKRKFFYGKDEFHENYDMYFFPHYAIDDIPENYCDLLINTFSLPEMEDRTSKVFMKQIDRILKADGKFFSMNRKETVHGKGKVKFTMKGINEIIEESHFLELEQETPLQENYSQHSDHFYPITNIETGLYRRRSH